MTLLNRDLSGGRTRSGTFPDEKSLREFDTFLALQRLGVQARPAAELAFSDPAGICRGLEQGQSLAQVFSRRRGWQLLEPLLQAMDLKQARDTIAALAATRSLWRGSAAWQLVYPVLLLAGAGAMVLFFDSAVVPMMADYLVADMLPMLMRLGRWAFLAALAVGTAAAGILAAGLQGIRKESIFYRSRFVRRVHTLFLAVCLHALLDQGVSTEGLFTIMKRLPAPPVCRRQIKALEAGIRSGKGWLESIRDCPYLDPVFIHHVQLGLETDDLPGLLDLYAVQTRRKLVETVKSMARRLSAAAYLSVGMLAILVYQILLAPMNMLSAI